ncbi:LysE family translocator [Saccharomonospora azurea]|uniref:Threonine efflux protein n=1 Tax=Saccharomonospora azurea NA-128 TaxID=882081 RepID=H8G6U6_9PSEU|nr:LysE family translocator [Saccharomonospora azurea]EHY91329.1 putative threonine efflux protein [Saccharomonospora azurea NA-128]
MIFSTVLTPATSAATLVALLVFLFPLAYSPGPGNAFFAALGAARGLRAALPALAGYHVATFVVAASIGLGMGVTVLEHPLLATVLSAVGSLYVLWLAVTIVRSARTKGGSRTTAATRQDQRIGFRSGAIVLLLNPKAYYIIAVMFTQFLRPPDGGGVVAVLVITIVFTLNNLVAFVAWALGGRALTALFRSERSKRWIDYGFAAVLVGVAAWLAAPLFR